MDMDQQRRELVMIVMIVPVPTGDKRIPKRLIGLL